MPLTLGGYNFAEAPKATYNNPDKKSTTQVYPAERGGAGIGVRVKSVVTAVGGGVRSSAFDADPKGDYSALKWTMPSGGKRASFCIADGTTDPECALSKLAEAHTAISEACNRHWGAPAQPFFNPSSDNFVYFDFSIWKNTAISDEAKVHSFGGGAVKVGECTQQPLPPKWRLLGFTAVPSHITVTQVSEIAIPTIRIHFRAVFLAGGKREELEQCGIPFPRLPEGDYESDEGDEAGKSYVGLSLADLTDSPPDTLPMEDVIQDEEVCNSPTPGPDHKAKGGKVFTKNPPGVKAPIAKKK